MVAGWFGRVSGGWPAAGAHWPGVAGQPAGVGEGTAEQEFDLGVGAAQLVVSPSGQGVVNGGVEAQQDALALAHAETVAAVTGTGSRC